MKKINKQIEIDKITVDKDLYPRTEENWQLSHIYHQSLLTGAKFPPIVLAKNNNKLILVDGLHRIRANQRNKQKEIEAEIYLGWDRRKIFEEAVKRNVSHGKSLTGYEKRKIALKLRNLKYKDENISDLIQVPLDKLENFIGQRLVSSVTGETIVKGNLKHFGGKEVEEKEFSKINEFTQHSSANNQKKIIEELIDLLENKYVDLSDEKIVERLEYLKKLLEEF